MSTKRTLRDHFVEALGDPETGRFKRLCNLMIDGRPLGEYPLDVKRTSEDSKRFEEIQWVGIALVGCDADSFTPGNS